MMLPLQEMLMLQLNYNMEADTLNQYGSTEPKQAQEQVDTTGFHYWETLLVLVRYLNCGALVFNFLTSFALGDNANLRSRPSSTVDGDYEVQLLDELLQNNTGGGFWPAAPPAWE